MNIIIVGGGRMGSGLCQKLSLEGHKITLIDTNQEVLEKLAKTSTFTAVNGLGFDKKVLEQAGIERSDALISCTNSDETNALIARISKNIYRVPHVIARLYDRDKAKIYSMLGVQTISTTDWGIARASEIITYTQLDGIMSLGGGVELVKVDVPALLVGKTIEEINRLGEVRVVSIERNNDAFLPTSGTILQPNDGLFIAVLNSSVGTLKSLLGMN
ncbi:MULTISPECIES: TrkA family potassium uptake protein [unclassified Breznakia]|uniref:potassium channel family protein n=1 Tax=unclassified Breznakia TaxID=2623764 RepID=UPI002475612C|nr:MULTISPECIES: TrkA family potassium uptake protein [unclassified Breznakia]MDH6365975.1 trk system potassium uptake protein TrkA [Breznakia sp. PH1-1]MDH6403093.1 trk system potassium uptake protein TrkA [Breznakia sp. PF1-11]MDH6410802.1 trk system potassium uptake protein TrkA [Breznakia sp. PFB1-11]MDH6413141.1 trk system potassium uptake protein TrkA [Breznakia sp. PFB1-14]MDH6415509.1 trk system potassium uptake protein TrkA [Breznakia sp. PFB1-4]